MEPVYATVIRSVVTLYRLYGWRIDVQGAEHVPARGGAVIAGNHLSYLDFTFMGYGTRTRGRLLRFLAKKEIFDTPGVGALMRGMHHIEVDRYGNAAESYRRAVAALKQGELIGMFPEGTIARSFVPARGKSGAARMAMEAGVPLIPVANWGGQRLYTKGRKRSFRRGVPVTVRFGPRIEYDANEDPQQVTKRLMASITALVDEAAAAYPDRPAGDADRWWLPAHLGGSAPTVEQADEMAAKARAEKVAQRAAERVRQREGRRASD